MKIINRLTNSYSYFEKLTEGCQMSRKLISEQSRFEHDGKLFSSKYHCQFKLLKNGIIVGSIKITNDPNLIEISIRGIYERSKDQINFGGFGRLIAIDNSIVDELGIHGQIWDQQLKLSWISTKTKPISDNETTTGSISVSFGREVNVDSCELKGLEKLYFASFPQN